MRDFFPIVCRLGRDLLATRGNTGQLARRTGRAEVKALVMTALLSPSPGQDLAVMLEVPEDVLEAWWQEARDMLTKASAGDEKNPALGIVA